MKKPVFKAPPETTGQRAKRLFREYVQVLATPHPVKWSDASPAVREYWMSKASQEG